MLTALHQVIVNEAMMGIIAVRARDLRCQYINYLAKEILEIDFDEIIEEVKITDFFPQEKSQEMTAFEMQTLNGSAKYYEILMQKKNGHVLIAEMGVKRIKIGEDDIVLVMFDDITFQKKLQREINIKQAELHLAYQDLLEQNSKLKELDEAKDRFLSMMTHELRTPLNAMMATSEIIYKKLYDNEEEKEEFLKLAYEQGLHLQALVNDILDFTKIQAGKMEYYIQQGLVSRVIKKIVEELIPFAKKAEVALNIECINNEVECYFDALRIGQVLSNIINNAIKFNKKNGTVTVGMTQTDQLTKVYIQDTGIGIEQDKLEKVFNEFETLGTLSNHQNGTGLGMPIARRIMNEHGGDLSVESEVGEGSAFIITIPNQKILEDKFYKSRTKNPEGLIF